MTTLQFLWLLAAVFFARATSEGFAFGFSALIAVIAIGVGLFA